MDDLDQRIDALYAGPPGGFTAGRDALAKDLRAAGEPDQAERVRQLRRPTRIAAELNRLARQEPEAMVAVIEAEEALEAAQRGVLEDTAGADDLRAAGESEARAIAALSADLDVRAALRLAARSLEAREDLRRGRLSRDPAPDPGAGLLGMGPVSLPPRPGRPPRPAPAAGPAPQPPKEREPPRPDAQSAVHAAARAERVAGDELTRARRRAEQADTERTRAAEALEQVRRELSEAEARLSAREDEARAAAAAHADAPSAVRDAAAHRRAAEQAVTPAGEGGRPT